MISGPVQIKRQRGVILLAFFVLLFMAGRRAATGWFTPNGWDIVTTYVQDTNDQATLTFTGCPNISYQLSYAALDSPASIEKIGEQC
jgi:hypothetical protein